MIHPANTIIEVKRIFEDSNNGEKNHNFKIGSKIRIIQHPRSYNHYFKEYHSYYVESAEEPKELAYSDKYLKFLSTLPQVREIGGLQEFIKTYPYSAFLHIDCL